MFKSFDDHGNWERQLFIKLLNTKNKLKVFLSEIITIHLGYKNLYSRGVVKNAVLLAQKLKTNLYIESF